MEALRLKKRIEADSVSLSGLGNLIGKDVEIIILEEPEEASKTLKPQRMPGSAKGFIKMSDDLCDPLPDDEIEEFYKFGRQPIQFY